MDGDEEQREAQEWAEFMAQEQAKLQMWVQLESEKIQLESEKMYKDFQRKHQLSDQALEDVMARVEDAVARRCGVKPVDVHLMAQPGGYGVS